MRTITRRIAAAHLVSSDGKLLFGRKRPGSGAVYEEFWHIPGGGIDEGETDEQAVIREVQEETGLNISNANISLVDNRATGNSEKTLENGERVFVDMQFNIFKVLLTTPAAEIETTESSDLYNFRWFSRAEFEELSVTPPATKLFERIGTDWLFNDHDSEQTG
jgi:8-oxo-dGTP pyrophosphatase MutT (NUDIX family)